MDDINRNAGFGGGGGGEAKRVCTIKEKASMQKSRQRGVPQEAQMRHRRGVGGPTQLGWGGVGWGGARWGKMGWGGV